MSRSRNKSRRVTTSRDFFLRASRLSKKKPWFYNCLFRESVLSKSIYDRATERVMRGTQAAQTRPMKMWRTRRRRPLASFISTVWFITSIFLNEVLSLPVRQFTFTSWIFISLKIYASNDSAYSLDEFLTAKLKTRKSNFECIAYIYLFS